MPAPPHGQYCRPAAKVTYGKEQAERLSIAVAPEYGGMPAGTVTVRSGKVAICVIALVAGNQPGRFWAISQI